jgi:hypothetical protein
MASIHPVNQGTIFETANGFIQMDDEDNPIAAFEDSTLITVYAFSNPTMKVWTMDELENNQAEDPFLWLALKIDGEVATGKPECTTLSTVTDDTAAYSAAGNEFPTECVLVLSSGPLLRWWHLSLVKDNPLILEGSKRIQIQLGLDDEPTVYQMYLKKIDDSDGKYMFESLQIVINNPIDPNFVKNMAILENNLEDLLGELA